MGWPRLANWLHRNKPRTYQHRYRPLIDGLEDRFVLNTAPVALITEPSFDGVEVSGYDVHMVLSFSDADPSDTHVATDWEIWTVGVNAEPVWRAVGVTDPLDKFHIHQADGTYVNSLAGRQELDPDTDYDLRVRVRDSSGNPATEWSTVAVRRFHTSPALQPIPGAGTWAVMQPGFKVEPVASGFQLPVNIAFVPNPGDHDHDPLFYVVELYGQIKVVLRNGNVEEYASGLLNFNPTGDFPGSGEKGVAGIVVEPSTGDLFVTLVYDSNGRHLQRVVRFHSEDGGITAASQSTVLDLNQEHTGPSHQISNISFGPDGKLYVHVGDGFFLSTPQNLDSYLGKILRLNPDGTAPSDNPFYNAADGITARDYIFSYGLRNPFGGAWRDADGQHYFVENGPSVDRFARMVAGRNYLYDGSDQSMRNYAIYNWDPAHAPVNMAFVQPSHFGGSRFPASKLDHAFVAESGPTFASGPQERGKRITEFVLDASGNLLQGPVDLIQYNGTGRATVVGLAAGPDGLYFTDLYADSGANPIAFGANVFRVRWIGTAPPAAPSALNAVPLSTTQIDLTWTDNADNEEGFRIEQALDGVNFVQIATVAANATSFTVNGLTAGVTYTFRVRGFNNDLGHGNYSATATATTPGTPQPPATPDNLIAQAGVQRVMLSWSSAARAVGYDVYRSLTSGASGALVAGGINGTSYIDVSGVPGVTYYYTVVAVNGVGSSAPSLEAGAAPLAVPTDPYVVPTTIGVTTKSLLTVGGAVPRLGGGADFRFVGIPDGIGAFDNGDGTITVLIDHELPADRGVPRAHGHAGALVSKLIIDKTTRQVLAGADLIQSLRLWDETTQAYVAGSEAIAKLSSADLPAVTAFFHADSGLGTTNRILLSGEEIRPSNANRHGRGFAHIATGPEAGRSYELPLLGKMAFENLVANPRAQSKTIVMALDDADRRFSAEGATEPSELFLYIGAKQATGNDIERAGLSNGNLFGIKVTGHANESGLAADVQYPFTLAGLDRNQVLADADGVWLQTQAIAAGITQFRRIEDGQFDPNNPADFYFATTDHFDGSSRLWRLRFQDIAQPELGGTLEMLLTGNEGGRMFDNLTVDQLGRVLLQEDPGNHPYRARIWIYDIETASLLPLAAHDPRFFDGTVTGNPLFLTQDEESSGIIDAGHLLGAGWYLFDVQAHPLNSSTHPGAPQQNDPELVGFGQLQAMHVGVLAQVYQGRLVVLGTAGDENIEVRLRPGNRVEVLLGGQSYAVFDRSSVLEIVVNSYGGNDTVYIDPALTFEVQINFQPASAPVPAGYLADTGAAFGDRGNGFSYGWDVNLAGGARDRNNPAAPDQRYDTLNHSSGRVWEIAVPNGSYTVRLVAGDPSYIDSVYRIDIEGVRVIDGIPSAANPWIEGAATVVVNDGRLTLRDGAGSSNNKVAFIDIRPAAPVQPPPSPTGLVATASATQINLSWASASGADTYSVYRGTTPGGQGSTPYATSISTTSFTDTNVGAGVTYYYRVSAVNQGGASPLSAEVSATPPQPPPPAAFEARINFQPAAAPVPNGYKADVGASFGDRGDGLTYGWQVNLNGASRDRNAPNAPDQRFDTLIHSSGHVWEIAVPNGSYTVRLVAGDPSYADSVYRVEVEGVLAVAGTPTFTSPWVEGTVTVNVADGRLTVRDAAGSSNNKLAFIDIAASGTATPPAIPTGVTATAGVEQVALSWSASLGASSYRIYRSTSSGGQGATPYASGITGTSFTDTGVVAGTTYYYRVSAVNSGGESQRSSEVSATPTAPPPPGSFAARINFQPAAAPAPTGYHVDSGAVFGARGNGLTYGWSLNIAGATRDRNASNAPDQRYDTLIHSSGHVWEIVVPNGSYSVRLVAGDPSYADSVYRIDVEGVRAVDGTPGAGNMWLEGTVAVTVSDGRLTIRDAAGSSNNKIAFVEINAAGSGGVSQVNTGTASPSASPSYDGPITVAGRFNMNVLASGVTLWQDQGSQPYRLVAQGRVLRFELGAAGTLTTKLPRKGVHHLAAVFDGQTARLHLNGKLLARRQLVESPVAPGNGSGDSLLAEPPPGVSIWRRALSAKEIKKLI